MSLAVLVAIAVQAISALTPLFDVQARAACIAPTGTQPTVSGIEVSPFPASAGDLSGLRVTHRATGAWMNVYFDAVSEAAAHARAACLGAQLAYLHELTGDDRPEAQWASAVFTADPGHAPSDGGAHWRIPTSNGDIVEATDQFLLITLPHEQVHHFQQRNGAETPRWFHEGHAEWVGRQVSAVISPDRAARAAASGAAELTASSESVALGRWGGVQVKREAILRQVSPSDRRRMEAEPNYMPDIPLSFGPGDITSDESNMQARYQASWVVFREIETARGSETIRRWVRDATAVSRKLTSADVVETGKAIFNLDLSERLK